MPHSPYDRLELEKTKANAICIIAFCDKELGKLAPKKVNSKQAQMMADLQAKHYRKHMPKQ